MRSFTADKHFRKCTVLKTPFAGDFARVYIREDNRIVVQHGGTFTPLQLPILSSLLTVIALATRYLDSVEREGEF